MEHKPVGRPPAAAVTDEDYILAAQVSRAYRAQHGLTQMSLAIVLGCNCQQISDIERRGPNRSTRVVAKILELYPDPTIG